MRLRLLTAAIALCMSFVVMLAQDAPAPEKKVVLVTTEENLLSQEIWGKWDTNRNFTKFLQDGLPKDEFGKIEVTRSEEATTRIVAALEKLVTTLAERNKGNDAEFVRAAKAVYATGAFKLNRAGQTLDADFALVSMFGEQFLILRSGKEDKPDWEFARVSFARHADGDHDLLLIGTDTKTGKYSALQREGVK
jgi:hypothetical protein